MGSLNCRVSNCLAGRIIGKNDSRISTIVNLPLALLLLAIAPAMGITDAHQLAFLLCTSVSMFRICTVSPTVLMAINAHAQVSIQAVPSSPERADAARVGSGARRQSH